MLLSQTDKNTQSQAWAPALVAAGAWGALPVLTRLVWKGGETQSNDATLLISVFLLLRFLFSSVFFSAMLRLFRPELRPIRNLINAFIAKKISLQVGLAWFLITLLNFWIQTLALSEIPAGIYALVFSLHPIVGVILSARSKGSFNSLAAWLRQDGSALLIILAGTILFCVTQDFKGSTPSLFGWLCLFGGMGTWLGYSLLSESLLEGGLQPMEVTGITQWVGLLSSAGVLFHIRSAFVLIDNNTEMLGGALISGALGLVAFGSYQVALSRSTKIAFLAQYLEPIAAIVTASMILGETVAGLQWTAASVTLLGLRQLNRKKEVQQS